MENVNQKYKNVFTTMGLLLNAQSESELYWLALSIEYADIDNYTEKPNSKSDIINNEIFVTRCKYHYLIKTQESTECVKAKTLINLRNTEEEMVNSLKAKLNCSTRELMPEIRKKPL